MSEQRQLAKRFVASDPDVADAPGVAVASPAVTDCAHPRHSVCAATLAEDGDDARGELAWCGVCGAVRVGGQAGDWKRPGVAGAATARAQDGFRGRMRTIVDAVRALAVGAHELHRRLVARPAIGFGVAAGELAAACDELVDSVRAVSEDVAGHPPAPSTPRKLFTVKVQTEMLVLGEDAQDAETSARCMFHEWADRDANKVVFSFEVKPMRHLPNGYDLDEYPEEDTVAHPELLELPERTVREWIELGAAPCYPANREPTGLGGGNGPGRGGSSLR